MRPASPSISGATQPTKEINPVQHSGISWDQPTANEDGSPLTDLSFYTVYVDGNPLVSCEDNTYHWDAWPFTDGAHGLTVTAWDGSGNESQHSEELRVEATTPVIIGFRIEPSGDVVFLENIGEPYEVEGTADFKGWGPALFPQTTNQYHFYRLRYP
jgi:hypothetical protein